MQRLIPLLLVLGLARATHLSLLPYAYLVDHPLPVYHQSQDTRTGEHAYSYSGGPSAKEEVKGHDGVTRGSYSYVDANGILQSVFYVADEGGFRVAATNLPTASDSTLESVEIQLARNFHDEKVKDDNKVDKQDNSDNQNSSRRRRSIQNPSDSLEEEKKEGDQIPAETANLYGVYGSVLLPKLAGATSHQSRIDIHRNYRLETEPVLPVQSVDANVYSPVVLPEVSLGYSSDKSSIETDDKVLEKAEPETKTEPITPVQTLEPLGVNVYSPVVVPQVPLATSHQSRFQIHNSVRVEPEYAPETANVKVNSLETQAEPVVNVIPSLEQFYNTLPAFSTILSAYQNPGIYRSLRLEGPGRKDSVKIWTEPLPVARPIFAGITTGILAEESIPVAVSGLQAHILAKNSIPIAVPAISTIPSAVSNQRRFQIHRNSKIELSAPDFQQPTVVLEGSPIPSYVKTVSTGLSTVLEPIPLAHSSQYRSQIHSSERVELDGAALVGVKDDEASKLS